MRKQQQAPGELELVRAFVNTADLEREEEHLVDPAALAAWLAERGLAEPEPKATAADLRRALQLREALRELLVAHTAGAPAPEAAVRTLNAASDRARLHLRFGEGGGASLQPQKPGVDGALGRLLAIVHDSITSGTWSRLKACRLEICEWAFYDHTKNHSGAWCNMDVCGNRAKARAYRRRQASAS
jgi:predicted RNA-binding Zn ribbon-like protein